MIREMYAEIQKQTDKHSVSELCEIYGVSRSGYYKWLKRAGQLNRYEKTHKILDSYVLDIHSHHPMMGYRQIRDKLYLEFGWIVSDPTVWKSMKRLRIHGYTRRRKATATGTNLEHIRYANVLNRKFKAEKPMQKIVTDVTYIKHNGKWYYLAGYLDLFNNEILEWELSDTFDNFLVMKPAERLGKATGMPMIVGEWHIGAADSGLDFGALYYAETQALRAQAIRYYMEQSTQEEHLVGIHYFEYNDQPYLGRFDGECYNIGLIDVCNRPYPLVVREFEDFARHMYPLLEGLEQPTCQPVPIWDMSRKQI